MRVVSPLLVLTVVAVFVSVPSAATDDVRFRIAHEYGLDGWDQVEELRYTFNVRAGEREVRRSWIWRPKDRGVTFTDELAGGEPFAYSLDDVGDNPPDKLRAIDHRFINDQYWLLFALHVAWDRPVDTRPATRTISMLGRTTASSNGCSGRVDRRNRRWRRRGRTRGNSDHC
jgi:hypothetical protein